MHVSGFSTARYATWFYLDQFKVLFDAGDGVAAALAGKCRRVQHVFLSHADRDHLGGLIQFNQLAARDDDPLRYYYPKDSGSFPALRDFLERFDPNLPKAEWIPLEAGMRIEISKQHAVEIGANNHIQMATRGGQDETKSLDFRLVETRRRLKDAFQGLRGSEIAELRATHGDDYISEARPVALFGYSGDTPAFDRERWAGTRVLVHEATFIAPDTADRGHSEMTAVIEAAVDVCPDTMILSHFSDRYDAAFIAASVREAAEKAAAPFPIYAILPRTTVWDVLSGAPIWQGLKAPGD